MENKELVNRLNRICIDIHDLAQEVQVLVGDRLNEEDLAWVQIIRCALYESDAPSLCSTITALKEAA